VVTPVAIVHFTGPPEVGGVEGLLPALAGAVTAAGKEPIIVAGSGQLIGHEVQVVEAMHPLDPAVRAAATELGAELPPDDHALVSRLCDRLRPLLGRCSDVWVLNCLTVLLNPFLTVALLRLLEETRGSTWISWSIDVTATSSHHTARHSAALHALRRFGSRVSHVTVSEYRRLELARLLSISPAAIAVVPPPIEASAWLKLGEEARAVVAQLEFGTADAVILTPAKLLPHKNLTIIPQVAARLRREVPRPLFLVTGPSSPHDDAGSCRVRGELRQLATHHGVHDLVHIVAGSSSPPPAREAVRDLMLLSDAVFLPSLEEGYGLPVAEAVLLRTPVVCTDLPPLREAGGDWPVYVDRDATADDIARCLAEVVSARGHARRHELYRSAGQFHRQVAELLSAPVQPKV